MSTHNNPNATRAELEEKYFQLVWFARSSPENKNPDVIQARKEVMNWYPNECAALMCAEEGDWNHGFNSGMLACLRLLTKAKITKNNREMFPSLDT